MASSHRPNANINQKSRNFDKSYEIAVSTGEINLIGFNLTHLPKIFDKGDLMDTVKCHLSQNLFIEIPEKICEFTYLEELNMSRNLLKTLPDFKQLYCLTVLNLSKNKLQSLPVDCLINLKLLTVLNVSDNRLVSLPDEIAELENLSRFDASTNEISYLPETIGFCRRLKILQLKSNKIVQLPINSLKYLKLSKLDLSANRIEKLPYDMADMDIGEILLNYNPLVRPSAQIARKGWKHIVKSLLKDKKRDIHEKEKPFRSSSSFSSLPSLSNQPTANLISNLSLPETTRRNSMPPEPPIRTVSQLSINYTKQSSPESTPKNSPKLINGSNHFSFPDDISSPISPNEPKVHVSYRQPKHVLSQNRTSTPDDVKNLPFRNNYNNSYNKINNNNNNNNNSFSENNSLPRRRSRDNAVPIIQDNKSIYTMERQERQAAAQQIAIDLLKASIEDKLKIRLPDYVPGALKDGVILCHLVNYLFPHSIDRIYVPSDSQTGLAIAKCQMNVNSFLAACRQNGVHSAYICSASVILEEKQNNYIDVCKTVDRLLSLQSTMPKTSAV